MQLLINLISLKTEPHNHRTTTTTQKRHLITSVVLCALGESHQVPPHRGKKLPEGMKTREAGVTELFQKQPTDLPSWTDESLPTMLGNDTCMSSVQLSCSVVPDSLRPHGLQHARLPCRLPTPGACSNSCPSSWRYHPTISSSVIPFSSCLQSFPASGSFLKSQFFADPLVSQFFISLSPPLYPCP